MSWQVGLYAVAVLIPLAAFAVEAIFIRQLKRLNAYIATGAIAFSCVLSLIGFLNYTWESGFFSHPGQEESGEAEPKGSAGAREVAVGAANRHGSEVQAAGSTGEAHSEAGSAAHSSAEHSLHKPLRWSASFDWVVLGGPAVASRASGDAPGLVV